ncbi:MAG: SDR family oxidoreductase [Verrucomicrobiae bacterium]|nr:SDR family oxidoreductase [Verrucomicrobiae bacterium]
MTRMEQLEARLRAQPRRWLITGAAGFIGSHLVETLLKWDQPVRGLDNFSTGKKDNLREVQKSVNARQWGQFELLEGDIRDLEQCRRACAGVDLVLHQAALGSVPRSLADPLGSHAVNVTGTLNVFHAAREAGVHRVIYASSSAVYGDHPDLPKVEARTGQPLSPYAATKCINEIYAGVMQRCYGLPTIGLRYFNVFGPRQDPEGPYAAVIPRWIARLMRGETVEIYGDGLTSRDFCPVINVVLANLLAALTEKELPPGRVYNIAVGQRTTLNELHGLLCAHLHQARPNLKLPPPAYKDFRPGDVRHSLADITQAQQELGYEPLETVTEGLARSMDWYLTHLDLPAPQ